MLDKNKTMFVKYKNPDGNYKDEAKRSFVLIKAYRFNPRYHKKLIFRNWYNNNIRYKKINWNNPWVVGVGLILITMFLALFFK